jgi:hypothetical protein
MRGVAITGAFISGALLVAVLTVFIYASNNVELSSDVVVRAIIACVVLGLLTVGFIVASSFGHWRAAWDNAWRSATGRRNED